MKGDTKKGSFGYDVQFFRNHNISTVLLHDESGAAVLIVPGYQGRVMTSAATGNQGRSFGWINYSYIDSGKISGQFNPFGGEERFWIGPEGGPFSVYFKKGDEQVFSNWRVPPQLDTDTFNVVSQSDRSVAFNKEFILTNASGTDFDLGVERTITLLKRNESEKYLGMPLTKTLSVVAYETDNVLINKGMNDWTKDSGFLSIWLLGMFNPSERGVVFIPFKPGSEAELGRIVTDDYFGKVPSDRLIVRDRILFFRTDGKYRSKIGISPLRALPWCGSYDPDNRALTILWFSQPQKPMPYVNSKWGAQDDPLRGDAVNSYNDGPVADGSIMGPFYEIESSSPAAMLEAGGKMKHTQRIFHISGDEAELDKITEKIFGTSLDEVKGAFK